MRRTINKSILFSIETFAHRFHFDSWMNENNWQTICLFLLLFVLKRTTRTSLRICPIVTLDGLVVKPLAARSARSTVTFFLSTWRILLAILFIRIEYKKKNARSRRGEEREKERNLSDIRRRRRRSSMRSVYSRNERICAVSAERIDLNEYFRIRRKEKKSNEGKFLIKIEEFTRTQSTSLIFHRQDTRRKEQEK